MYSVHLDELEAQQPAPVSYDHIYCTSTADTYTTSTTAELWQHQLLLETPPTNITPSTADSAALYTYTNQSSTPEPRAARVSPPD